MKECWQLINLEKPTPCFKKAGNTPCNAPGCPVIDKLKELKELGLPVDEWWLKMLPHSVCRISSLSPDNQEYLQRVNQIVTPSRNLV